MRYRTGFASTLTSRPPAVQPSRIEFDAAYMLGPDWIARGFPPGSATSCTELCGPGVVNASAWPDGAQVGKRAVTPAATGSLAPAADGVHARRGLCAARVLAVEPTAVDEQILAVRGETQQGLVGVDRRGGQRAIGARADATNVHNGV